MKKNCAVFTIVKNENFNIKIWLAHYKKFFDASDIYVLDHQSTDRCTNDLDVNVISVENDLAFDHQWLVNTVQQFQSDLLTKYKCVIFAEADELVYSTGKPLSETIEDFIQSDAEYITCQGFDVLQNLTEEKPLELGEDVFKHRNYWYPNPIYDKTLISKVPLHWEWGFHKTTRPDAFGFNVFMAHLHRVDFEQMYLRHNERATKWNLKNDGGAGFHHRIGDREGVMNFFNEVPHHAVTSIPEEHKCQLIRK